MTKSMPHPRRWLASILALVTCLLALWTLPSAWCRRGASAWYEGKVEAQQELARTVMRQINEGLATKDFHTGVRTFDGEWLFGTHMMAGAGLCQIALQHPETKAEWTPGIIQCIRQLLTEDVRKFDRNQWRADALETLEKTDQGHVAYLGYLNFLLSLYREIDPRNEFAALNDQITAALVRRYEASKTGLLATYPDEFYPVDNTPALASLALHGRATGQDHTALLAREEKLLRTRYIDPASGLLVQAVDENGSPVDAPRGSGSALGIFSEPGFS